MHNNQQIINGSYPPIKCNVSGYELRDAAKDNSLKIHKLFGGSEGTLGVITKLTFRVIRKKPYNALVIAYFDNKTNSSKAAQVGLQFEPAGIEIMDKSLLSLAVAHEPSLEGRLPTDVDNVLMFEFEGESVEEVSKYCHDTVKEITDKNYATQAFTAASFTGIIPTGRCVRRAGHRPAAAASLYSTFPARKCATISIRFSRRCFRAPTSLILNGI